MRSTRSQLIEQVVMLSKTPKDCPTDTLMLEKYVQCYTTRAKILPLGYATDGAQIYSIEVPLPPAKFRQISFACVLWHDNEYIFISPLKLNQNGFMISKIKATT